MKYRCVARAQNRREFACRLSSENLFSKSATDPLTSIWPPVASRDEHHRPTHHRSFERHYSPVVLSQALIISLSIDCRIRLISGRVATDPLSRRLCWFRRKYSYIDKDASKNGLLPSPLNLAAACRFLLNVTPPYSPAQRLI